MGGAPTISSEVWRNIPIFAALAFRFSLFAFSSLPDALENRIELSTPLTNLRRLKEGVYLHQHGVNPYVGSTFHHSPLYLAAFSTVINLSSRLVTALVWTLVDYIAAKALQSIWRARKEEEQASGYGTRTWLRGGWQEHVMTLYLMNPFTIATCLARSTTSIDNALTFLSIAYAAQGQAALAMFYLSLATHSQFYPLLLVVPICMVLLSNNSKDQADTPKGTETWRAIAGWIAIFVSFVALHYALAYITVGSNQFVHQTWGTILSVSDLTPNVGLSWYFFTEMFDHFRKFYTGVFQLHVLLYVVPICVRLRHQPLLATAILSAIISVFKSYPTLGDSAVWLGLLGCFPDIWDALRHPLLTAALFLYSTLLLPILLELWLVSATGNANFMYAATMVHSLGCGLGVLDMLGAALRNEVGERTCLLLDAKDRKQAESDGSTAKREEAQSQQISSDLKSATRILEDRNLAIVQYTTLDD